MSPRARHAPPRPWRRRLGWLLAIWSRSVGALVVVALVFRFLMAAVGLSR